MYGRRSRRRAFSRRRQFGFSRFVTDPIAFSEKLDITDQNSTSAFCILPGIIMAGVSKVRSFRLELSCPVPIAFALLYFLEEINPKTAKLNESKPDIPSSLDTPEQHIMTSGIVSDSALTIARASIAMVKLMPEALSRRVGLKDVRL
jgi:hypothetical protein